MRERRTAKCHRSDQPLEFCPENIHGDGEGRWFFGDREVTDLAVWWQCPQGHSFTASIAQRVAGTECFVCSEK